MVSCSETESSPALNKFNNDGSFFEQFKKLKSSKTGMRSVFWGISYDLAIIFHSGNNKNELGIIIYS